MCFVCVCVCVCVAIDDECHSMGGALSGGYKLTATCWLINPKDQAIIP